MRIFFAVLLGIVSLSLIGVGCHKKEEPSTKNVEEPQPELREFPTFSTKSIETIRGQVVNIMRVNYPERFGYMVEIILRTDEGDIPVQLGPGSYVEGESIQILPYDELEVTGSRLYSNGQILIVATEIRKGDYRLMLRNKQGEPLWNAWKRDSK